MTLFGLKEGQDLKNRVAHTPTKNSKEYPDEQNVNKTKRATFATFAVSIGRQCLLTVPCKHSNYIILDTES